MENTNQIYEQKFTKEIIKYGRLTNLLAIPLCFIPAAIMAVAYKAMPSTSDILGGWALIFSIFGVYAIVEPISYFPVLGLPGTYMSFLAGNIGNMRLPCSAIAQKAVGVEPGSKKAELVSTLGIAGSIITNLIIVTLAAIAGAAIMEVLPVGIKTAFNYASTAIFAATFSMSAVKKPILGVYAIGMSLILLRIIKVVPLYVMIPFIIFSTVLLGFKLIDMEDKKEKEVEAKK